MNRAMVNLIKAEGFFPDGDAQKYSCIVHSLNFTETEFGVEIPNFKMVFPNMEPMFSRVIGERVKIDSNRSGVFRKPHENIHFEDFDSLDEWCFIVALERSTFNIYNHLADDTFSDLDNRGRNINAKTALDGYKFNYRNLFEWDIHTNILLEPNEGIFFRPWIFHGLERGLVQYYRLIADSKFRILITGLPGSIRSRLAEELQKKLPNSVILRSADIRKQEKDIDFTNDGKMRHIYRMLDLAREKKEDFVIVDMVCPLPEMREILNADIVIWAADKTTCEYQDLNASYIPPSMYDIKCNSISENILNDIIERIKSKKL